MTGTRPDITAKQVNLLIREDRDHVEFREVVG